MWVTRERMWVTLRLWAEGGEEESYGSDGGDGIAEENSGDGERIAFDDEVAPGEEEAGESSEIESGAMKRGEARGASGEQHGEDDAEGNGVKLNEGVGPETGFPGVPQGEIPAGERGDDEHEDGDDEHSTRGELAHGGGPEKIELLLQGDEPERKDDRRGKSDEDHPPVSGEEQEGETGAPSDVLSGNDPLQGPGKGEEEKIEGPDAQEAANVERLEIDLAAKGPLTDEKLCDEVGAEEEEEFDAEGSGGTECAKDGREHGSNAETRVKGRVVRNGVMNEDEEEG